MEQVNANKKRNVVIYCRQSQNKVDDQACELQEKNCKEYCQANQHNILEVVYETVSARNMQMMKKFNKLVAITPPGTLLLVSDISRFSRNVRQALETIETLKNKGIEIYAVNNNCGYDEYLNRFQFRSYLNQAELESDRISERVKKSINGRRKLGCKIGRSKFGYETFYDVDGWRKERINRHEHKILEEIKKLKKLNYSVREITDHLNETKQIDRIRWKKWTYSRVRNIIMNIRETYSYDLDQTDGS